MNCLQSSTLLGLYRYFLINAHTPWPSLVCCVYFETLIFFLPWHLSRNKSVLDTCQWHWHSVWCEQTGVSYMWAIWAFSPFCNSLFLHKLGVAPEIENLVGTVTFTGMPCNAHFTCLHLSNFTPSLSPSPFFFSSSFLSVPFSFPLPQPLMVFRGWNQCHEVWVG